MSSTAADCLSWRRIEFGSAERTGGQTRAGTLCPEHGLGVGRRGGLEDDFVGLGFDGGGDFGGGAHLREAAFGFDQLVGGHGLEEFGPDALGAGNGAAGGEADPLKGAGRLGSVPRPLA